MPKITLNNVNIVLTGQRFSPAYLERSSLTHVLDKPPSNFISTPVFSMLEFPGGIQVTLDEMRFQAMDRGTSHPSGSKVQTLTREFIRIAREPNITAVGCNFVITVDFEGQDGHAYLTSLLRRESDLSNIVGAQSPRIGLKLFYSWHDAKCTVIVEPHFRVEPARNLFVDVNYHTDVGSTNQAEKAIDTTVDAYEHVSGVIQGLLAL